ncbi:Hypothetical protein ORPV_468 [Orpheovirus IHUMI-LCC2]|uniref:Uncharacterized protein n=1 Tax=Orpheovirus IHUMI-LCC2 TaxID=2023057 RepID=A0A2I2L499_9VIRU|nr:Hypothetical protein ORPV_468 [Orpheovirus IHUMI-LCC2]SNW62372.1 Hypothetical protein ORPV_468 [Orpheovirus IHUMI-LCC2]
MCSMKVFAMLMEPIEGMELPTIELLEKPKLDEEMCMLYGVQFIAILEQGIKEEADNLSNEDLYLGLDNGLYVLWLKSLKNESLNTHPLLSEIPYNIFEVTREKVIQLLQYSKDRGYKHYNYYMKLLNFD